MSFSVCLARYKQYLKSRNVLRRRAFSGLPEPWHVTMRHSSPILIDFPLLFIGDLKEGSVDQELKSLDAEQQSLVTFATRQQKCAQDAVEAYLQMIKVIVCHFPLPSEGFALDLVVFVVEI